MNNSLKGIVYHTFEQQNQPETLILIQKKIKYCLKRKKTVHNWTAIICRAFPASIMDLAILLTKMQTKKKPE